MDAAALGYLRLYADADGESHFEEVRLAPVGNPGEPGGGRGERAKPIAVSEVVFRRVVDDGEPARAHPAPRRQFVVQLVGEVEVEASDGEVRRLGPGSVVLVEDLEGAGHVTRPVGDGAERLTLFLPLVD
jgi:quercetin dioxygenase-like cupin family protein